MEALVHLSEETVPARYLTDPMPEVKAEYGFKLFTKSVPDEKEIAQVFVAKKPRDVRVGWLIPVLSIVSLEHELAEDKYFIKHVYEVMKFLKDQALHESIYILVYSKRYLRDASVDEEGEMSLAFLPYGVYPYYSKFSVYIGSPRLALGKLIVIDKCFNADRAVGFFQVLVTKIMPGETNEYARFMFFYQVYELAMELVFYKKIRELKAKRSHLGIIRSRMGDYSSEGKLISLLYVEMGREESDAGLAIVAKYIFEDVKEESYYSDTKKSAMLYDVRNTLVHSYYRFKISEKLSYLASYIESEVFHIISYLYSEPEIKSEMEDDYFHDGRV